MLIIAIGIIGAIYDFKNKYKQGYNRLIILNLNGEKDPKIIAKSPYLIPIAIINTVV